MKNVKEKGQALITLLFFMIIGGVVTASAIAVVLVNSLSASKMELSDNAYAIAESGAENAILRILRDPSYSGETLQIGDGAAEVHVASSSGSIFTITSLGSMSGFSRKIKIDLVYTNTMQINSWKETY